MEQLAEESVELAHAALKLARIIRGENPTPVLYMDALRKLREEYTDVFTAAVAAELLVDSDISRIKLDRWATRIRENETEETE